MEKVTEVNHPLITHKLTLLRDRRTGTKEFGEIIREIASYLCYKATEDAKLTPKEIVTPVAVDKLTETDYLDDGLSASEDGYVKMQTGEIDEDYYVLVPIIRAGLGMIEGAKAVIPNVKIAHIGEFRNENYMPVRYYFKAPNDVANREAIILDPMLATGGSSIDVVNALKSCKVKRIKMVCIIAAPEGIEALSAAHPDVPIICAHIDRGLNEKKYIVPGLGDAGDRIFGTK